MQQWVCASEALFGTLAHWPMLYWIMRVLRYMTEKWAERNDQRDDPGGFDSFAVFRPWSDTCFVYKMILSSVYMARVALQIPFALFKDTPNEVEKYTGVGLQGPSMRTRLVLCLPSKAIFFCWSANSLNTNFSSTQTYSCSTLIQPWLKWAFVRWRKLGCLIKQLVKTKESK